MSVHIHTTGKLKEILRLKDESFEQMCLRILIKEGIVKENPIDEIYDNPQYHHVFYWSDLVDRELGDKYLTMCDWGGFDRLFEIIDRKNETISIERSNVEEIEEGEYTFDTVYDSSRYFRYAIAEDFPRKKL